jgi:hypothetical protein
MDIPIVFVHLGFTPPPPHAEIAVQQARRWNPTAPITVFTSVVPDLGYSAGEEWVKMNTVPKTEEHIRFQTNTILDTAFRDGFWRFSTERLFCLYDWMQWKGVSECIHIENDNTIYFSVADMLPLLRANTKGMSATFHGESHMCYSVMYCNDPKSLSEFLFFLGTGHYNLDEMRRGADFWEANPEICSLLPVVPPGAALKSEEFRPLCENAAFPCVFDAAAHGQYLGGEDPRNGERGPGFINEDAEFRADQFAYIWKKDAAERLYPLVIDKDGKQWPLANLHIHSKRLQDFI